MTRHDQAGTPSPHPSSHTDRLSASDYGYVEPPVFVAAHGA